MISNYFNKQKSPKRRFLFLGVIRLVLMVALGLMVIFWHKIDLNLTAANRLIVGALIIVIGVVRFVFSNKNQADGQI